MATKSMTFEISNMTLSITEVLRNLQAGETISYMNLSKQSGFDVLKNRSYLTSARRHLQHEERIVFGTIRGEGLKRMVDSEIAKTGNAVLRKVNRAARRGVNTLSCINDYAALSQEEQIRHNSAMSLLGVFYQVSKAKSLQQIDAAVAVLQRKLPFQETLRAFLGVS